MKMISVLHFLNTLARAGTEEHVLTLLRGLDRSRFRLSLVCTPSVAEKLGPDVPPDVRMVPLSLRKPTDLVAAATLAPGRRLKPALIRVYVAALAAGQTLYEKYGEAADAFLTAVGYFSSLRELGGMRRLVPLLRELERQGFEGKLTNASELCQDAGREFETIRHFLESYLARQGELASRS